MLAQCIYVQNNLASFTIWWMFIALGTAIVGKSHFEGHLTGNLEENVSPGQEVYSLKPAALHCSQMFYAQLGVQIHLLDCQMEQHFFTSTTNSGHLVSLWQTVRMGR